MNKIKDKNSLSNHGRVRKTTQSFGGLKKVPLELTYAVQ